MKNGIIIVTVIAAAVVAGVLLSSDEDDGDGVSVGPGGVVDTQELTELVMAREKSVDDEKLKDIPVPSETGPWPKVFVEETTHDFGKMQIGAELEHVFVIRNDGDGPMNLLAGKSSCKCTGFTLSTQQLQTGEEAELKVRWIGKFRDPGFQHGGPVYTDDPDRPKVSFAVKGVVDSALEILPADVWSLGQLSDGQAGIMKAKLISKIHDDFTVTSVESESPFVSVELTRMTPEAIKKMEAVSGYEVSVRVSPDIPAGSFESKLELKIDRLEKVTSVIVKATKSGPIKILPAPGVIWLSSNNALKLGQFSGNKGREVELVLLVNEDQLDGDFELTSISAKPSFIKAALKLLRKVDEHTGRYALKVTIPPGIPKSKYDRDKPAVLTLETNHPANPTLTINISFRTF